MSVNRESHPHPTYAKQLILPGPIRQGLISNQMFSSNLAQSLPLLYSGSNLYFYSSLGSNLLLLCFVCASSLLWTGRPQESWNVQSRQRLIVTEASVSPVCLQKGLMRLCTLTYHGSSCFPLSLSKIPWLYFSNIPQAWLIKKKR